MPKSFLAVHPTTNRVNNLTRALAQAAGLTSKDWGQAACVGDFDHDGFDDLFVTYFGRNVLYRNNGDGTFTDVSEKAGVARISRPRPS